MLHFGKGQHELHEHNTVIHKQEVDAIILRVLNNEPLQYVLGYAWFYGMKLKVTKDVLIPRPETEELADICRKYCAVTAPHSIIDIGTGSGCIAIALKIHLEKIRITAIDVSTGALAVAMENARQQNTEINFVQTNFLDEKLWNQFGQFDIIISNPPYIPESNATSLEANVLDYEPHIALFAPDDNPLIFYEKIAAFAGTHLTTNGKILLETHWDNAHEVEKIFENNGLHAEVRKDMSGNNRFVVASRLR